jgi:membrane protein DedA with SNARE-associated domain
MEQIFDAIRLYGELVYGFIFAYAASNSLLVVLFAGYVAHAGALDFGKLILICWAGGFTGDCIRFWIGRRFGTKWLRSMPRFEQALLAVARLADRHYLWLFFIYRFPNGIRSAAGFAFGISRLPLSAFLALNFASAGVWSVAVVSAGYGFAHLSDKTLNDAASGLGLALMIAFLGLFWLLSQKLERVIEKK